MSTTAQQLETLTRRIAELQGLVAAERAKVAARAPAGPVDIEPARVLYLMSTTLKVMEKRKAKLEALQHRDAAAPLAPSRPPAREPGRRAFPLSPLAGRG